jgi:two-component system response regulator YesN
MSYKLLLVDDDKEFHEEFADALEGYEVHWAPNGEEALRFLRRPNDIDLVLLDVRMPGMSGTDVLKKIRETNPRLGVIILTGHSSKEVAVEALKSRADDFLEKPCHPQKAREAIERVLEDRGVKGTVDDGSTEGKVDRVGELVRRNWDKKTTLEDVAKAVCLSPKYLSRVFKEMKGQDFGDFRTAVKLENAKRLLKETRDNVGKISDRLGYENVESFVRMFKKGTSVTPTEYRADGIQKTMGGGGKRGTRSRRSPH